jgi:ElaB/YqjD/DUF883 family membrane-anchored ribosome-binding protein
MQQHDMDELSADKIAADLERERGHLEQTINALRERLSVDRLLGDVMGYARAHAAPYVHALDGAVRANPAAAVMAGVGLAWLVLGRQGGGRSSAESSLAGTRTEALARWEDEGGQAAASPSAQDDSWIVEADRLRDTAASALDRIDDAARYLLRPAQEIAAERAEVLATLATATRAALSRGLENLGREAQSRVLATREHAYAARLAVVRQGVALIDERPIVVGAIGMAIGAAVAAALPRTETEDRLFGPDRDRLMIRARQVLRQERERAAMIGSELADLVTDGIKHSVEKLVAKAS